MTPPGRRTICRGPLLAGVQFAQSQILPAHPREGDNQPRLTALRKSLLLVRPLQAGNQAPLALEARDGAGKLLGSLTLDPPSRLPKTAYYLEGTPEEGVDFTPGPGTSAVINSSSELARLSDPSGAFLLGKLQPHALVTIQTADGRWVRDIHLPRDVSLEGKMVRLASNAGYNSTVYFSGRQVTISRGQSQQFKFVRGQWIPRWRAGKQRHHLCQRCLERRAAGRVDHARPHPAPEPGGSER